jgi:acetoin utilization deacetylase AcuC-like enzyme
MTTQVGKAKPSLGLVFFPAYDWAITPSHPEREERLLYTQDQVVEEGLLDLQGVRQFKPRLATSTDVTRVHICVPDVSAVTTSPHLISAGGAIIAAEKYMEGAVNKSFALVRPPGHHSFRVVLGNRGFCNINNEAIMAEWIRATYGARLKIAFVDTDAHHADGTQDIYYHDPLVLHISLHQDGRTLYPGSGFVDELGGPGALARTLNVPLPPRTTDEGYLYVIDEFVLPVLRDFEPDVIINSAGQDNHYSDPITNMGITAQGYAELNHLLDPDISILQGGYSIEDALPYTNVGILLAMAGLDYSHVKEPDYHPSRSQQDRHTMDKIRRIVDHLLTTWSNRDHLESGQFRDMGDGYFERRRRVFYDTDYISDQQREVVKVCDKDGCPGHLFLESQGAFPTGRIISTASVILPRLACNECQDAAVTQYELYCNEGQHEFVYLQDQVRDSYPRWTRGGR